MKLLIVDDNANMRKSIRSIVTTSTDIVFECEDGDAVLATYSKTHPDFVLMDIKMPKVNGIKTMENLKKGFPEARVLILTNYSDNEFREAAKEAGAEKYFMKDNFMEVKKYLISEMKKM